MDSWHSFVFCSFSFPESYKQPHDGIKVSHLPNFTIFAKTWVPIFLVLLEGMIPSLLFPPLLGMFLKMKCHLGLKRWYKGHSIFQIAPPLLLVFSVLPGRYPPSFMAKKEIQIGACLYTRLSFWLRAL